MENLAFEEIDCPYCGEAIECTLDLSAGPQAYIEDCSVCCRPIEFMLFHDGDRWRLSVRRDDD